MIFFTKNLSLFKDGFPNLCRARWCFFLHLSPQAPLWVSTHHLPCFPNLSFSLLRAKMTRNKNTWIHISMIYWSKYKDADTHFAKHVYGNISFSPVIYTGGKSCLLWVNNPTLSSVLCRIFCQNNARQFFNSGLHKNFEMLTMFQYNGNNELWYLAATNFFRHFLQTFQELKKKCPDIENPFWDSHYIQSVCAFVSLDCSTRDAFMAEIELAACIVFTLLL